MDSKWDIGYGIEEIQGLSRLKRGLIIGWKRFKGLGEKFVAVQFYMRQLDLFEKCMGEIKR